MRWRNRNWPERTLRPKVAKLPREALQRLHARAVKFVEESLILCELVGVLSAGLKKTEFFRKCDGPGIG